MSSYLWRNSFCRFIAGPSFLPAVNRNPDIHRSPAPKEMTKCRSYRADADRAGPFEPLARAAAIPHRLSNGSRTIFERNAERFRRSPGDSRLEKNVTGRRCNEAENGDDRPSQNPRLPARKPCHHLTPASKSLFHVACAMKEVVKPLRKGPGSRRRLDPVPECHLLE